jgi:hypothetical protein
VRGEAQESTCARHIDGETEGQTNIGIQRHTETVSESKSKSESDRERERESEREG